MKGNVGREHPRGLGGKNPILLYGGARFRWDGRSISEGGLSLLMGERADQRPAWFRLGEKI